MYTLKFSQIVHATLPEVWDFFSSPHNLSKITPPALNFKVLEKELPRIHPGMLIHYQVSPVLKLKQLWVSEISHVREGEYFVDEQRVGPYRIWHHQHFFKPIADGVLVEDQIDYQIGFGPLDPLINAILVRKKILEIFEFRKVSIGEIFKLP